MKLFDWISDLFDFGPSVNPASGLPIVGASGVDAAGNPIGTSTFSHIDAWPIVNPASGLPMLGDSGVDAMGNPFGTDLHSDFGMDTFDHSSMFDSIGCGSSFDSFDRGCSGFGSNPWD